MFKRCSFLSALWFSIFLVNPEITPQSQAMYYLNYPRSMQGLGMGEQSVALRTSEDALTYNPANLIFIERPTISFFHQPFQMAAYILPGFGIPLNSLNVVYKISNIGAFGIEYVDWDLGEMYVSTTNDPQGEGPYQAYERSFSIGYAREFYNNFSSGIQLRYAKTGIGPSSADILLFTAGLNYSPKLFGDKFNLGFSLTNFGGTVDYPRMNTAEESTISDPPPSKFNLGIGYIPFENNFFSLQTQLAISKPFDDRPAVSSFKGLFSDWNDFPNDVTLHTGIGFNWKPLDLGCGFSFFQELYLGNYSVGNKAVLNNFYTHGGKIGIEFEGLQFTAGYAGRWHNVHYSKYLPWLFPYETVQFTFGMSDNILFRKENVMTETAKPKNILLSFGVGKSFRVGKLSERSYPGLLDVSEGFEDGNVFFVESAFYINEKNAVVSNLSYNPTYYIVKYQGKELINSKVEIVSFASSYRFHPLEILLPLYLQGGLAIIRLNPTQPYFYPKYDYKTSILLSIGGDIGIFEGIVLCPFVGYNMMLSRDGNTAPRLGGFNQFDSGVKVGYKF